MTPKENNDVLEDTLNRLKQFGLNSRFKVTILNVTGQKAKCKVWLNISDKITGRKETLNPMVGYAGSTLILDELTPQINQFVGECEKIKSVYTKRVGGV